MDKCIQCEIVDIATSVENNAIKEFLKQSK